VAIVGMAWNAKGSRAAHREVQAFRPSVRGNLPFEGQFPHNSRPIRSDAKGLYAVCGLPPNGPVQLITVDAAKVFVELPVMLEGESRWVELREWGSADTSIVPLKLTAPVEGARLDTVPVAEEPKVPQGAGFEGFEARRRIGRGRFLDSTELRRNQHQYLDGLLIGIPGISIVSPPQCGRSRQSDCVSGRLIHVALTGRLLESDRCFLQVVVDGVVLGRGGIHRWEDGFDLSMLRVSELRGVEVYRSGAEVPAEFNDAHAECGVLVLWTKR
jgi:hypothetical protein